MIKNDYKGKAGIGMGKILQQLFRGELCPSEYTIQGNAEYDALTRQSLEEMNRFAGKELTYLEKSQCFSDGFRIGAGVMCEVFYENRACQGEA